MMATKKKITFKINPKQSVEYVVWYVGQWTGDEGKEIFRYPLEEGDVDLLSGGYTLHWTVTGKENESYPLTLGGKISLIEGGNLCFDDPIKIGTLGRGSWNEHFEVA